MKHMGLNQLRESYLNFFEGKGHLRLESAPLVPIDDNSILLINAGMTPLKKYFTGEVTPPRNRCASCQKCIRTPDIENVGITARHGTFFEMLGNFSFGDYFKSDACKWAWEYFTQVLEIPADLLWVSIYEEDDEAHDIWVNEVGVPAERIVRFGKKDNFWEHGSGPCGPCSEIYIDRGPGARAGAFGECSNPDCKVGCECDRFIEVWNLVFTQFDSDGNGNYTPLANKNIDTGMGLERLACIMQGAANMFEVDTIKDIIAEIERISRSRGDLRRPVEYGQDSKSDVSVRVITDHVRSSTFMISDGVLPSNEGRGYVLRRLLRRAARHGRLLGIKDSFLYELCDKVIESSGGAYPNLAEKREYIKKTIKAEEESFVKTVEKGLELLDTEIGTRRDDCIDGGIVFRLHDTFGFPVDLTREILNEQGLTFDENRFAELMKNQKETARANQAFKGGWGENLAGQLSAVSETIFVNLPELETIVLEIIETEEAVLIVLEKTPFYAESGGQVGDTGVIYKDGISTEVYDTKKAPSGQTICYCSNENETNLRKGDIVKVKIDAVRRDAIMRNHTTAHILQAALQAVLGDHVHQAGSLVDEKRCRFDFTHNQALSAEEIEVIEGYVNEVILENIPVETEKMSLEEARSIGAMALFGEKYGDMVRVVSIRNPYVDGNVSTELCGGCHVRNTGQIGLFKIISEASIAAGVRRIEAVTGFNVLELLAGKQNEIEEAADKLKSANQTSTKEIARLNSIIAAMQAKSAAVEEVGEVNGVKLLTQKIPGADANAIRQAADNLQSTADNGQSTVIVVAGESNFFCRCGAEAVAKGFHAGNILREIAAVTGGKGGGKPDSAMAGIGDVNKVDDALANFVKIVS